MLQTDEKQRDKTQADRNKMLLTAGGLLHDIGKVIYRTGTDRRNHSTVGYDYLKTEAGMQDEKEILDCVRFHHSSMLKGAAIADDSLAYIVYIADNIAAFADRRKKETEGDEKGFDLSVPLQSVFNVLNGNHQEYYYAPGDINLGDIRYPSEQKEKFSQSFYTEIRQRLTANLRGLKLEREYLDSLLTVMEANLSYIPSSTSKAELSDISLFDHVRLTAALAVCIYDYLKEKYPEDTGFRERLFRTDGFYDEKAFTLWTFELTGTERFISMSGRQNVLKNMRARAFYTEMIMEHLIDRTLDELGLSRANLLYSGGNRCYLLLPNTEETRKIIEEKILDDTWFIRNFRDDLHVLGTYVECSGNTFRNVPEGSFTQMFADLQKKAEAKKRHPYSALSVKALRYGLATNRQGNRGRECRICRRLCYHEEDGICFTCRNLENFSANVLYSDFFSVVQPRDFEEYMSWRNGADIINSPICSTELDMMAFRVGPWAPFSETYRKETEEVLDGLLLPGDFLMTAEKNEEALKMRMENMQEVPYIRVYTKNRMYTGKYITTKIWTGDYTSGETFEEFAEKSRGIRRVGVLKLNVDDMKHTLTEGIPVHYAALSRTAVLSRQLSMFFKYYIRFILKDGGYSLDGEEKHQKRKATVIYSSGDEMLLVGAWDDVVELAVDVRRSFEKYTQGTMHLSASIGLYDSSYPAAAIVQEMSERQKESKYLPGKNSITLLEDGERHFAEDGKHSISDGTYSWAEFEQEVIAEKYRTLAEFFQGTEERGKSFLYHILELVRNQKERINFARMVYTLSRLEPAEEGEKKEAYRKFSGKMYQWIQSEKDCRQLKTAINLYAYLNRERGENSHADK